MFEVRLWDIQSLRSYYKMQAMKSSRNKRSIIYDLSVSICVLVHKCICSSQRTICSSQHSFQCGCYVLMSVSLYRPRVNIRQVFSFRLITLFFTFNTSLYVFLCLYKFVCLKTKVSVWSLELELHAWSPIWVLCKSS